MESECDTTRRELEETLELLDGHEVWLLPDRLKKKRLNALGWLPPLCPKCHGIIGAYFGTPNLTCLRCKTTFKFDEVIKKE